MDEQTYHVVLKCKDVSLLHGTRVEVACEADARAGKDAVGERTENGLSGVHGEQVGVR